MPLTKAQCTIPQTRNTVPVLLSMLPADLAKLDAIERSVRRGPRPNRSAALRVVLDAYPDPSPPDRPAGATNPKKRSRKEK